MLKQFIKKIIGQKNVTYLNSFLLSKDQKEQRSIQLREIQRQKQEKEAKEAVLTKKRYAFYSQFLKKGDLYFDVGANYGNRIEALINLDLKIIAIEPQEECVSFLKEKYGNAIEVIPKGLGVKKEEKTMYISNASTLSSFSKDWIDATQKSGRFQNYQWDTQKTIQMTTLDNLIAKFGLPDFIKIDVEGFELEVLKGLNQNVKMLSIEYAVPESIDKTIQCLKRLKEISGDKEILCNYSIAEGMEWALKTWVSFEEMILKIKTTEFINTSFGDIYIKFN